MSGIQPDFSRFQPETLGPGFKTYSGKEAQKAKLKGYGVEITLGGKTYVADKKEIKKWINDNSREAKDINNKSAKTLGKIVEGILDSIKKSK